MKKKLLIVLLTIIAVLGCVFGLSACDLFGGNDGQNQGENQEDNKSDDLSVIGKTFYFSTATVIMDDKEAALKLENQIKSDMKGAVVKFFADGTADISSGESATWTQTDDTVTITTMGISSPYKVTANTLSQSSSSDGFSFIVFFTTEKPVQHKVTLINENPEAGTVTGDGLYDHGETVTIKANVTKQGYYFSGLYEGENLVDEVDAFREGYSFAADRDVTYTAKWVYCAVNVLDFDPSVGTITYNYNYSKQNNTLAVSLHSIENPDYIILGYYYYYSHKPATVYFNACIGRNHFTGLNGFSFTIISDLNLRIVYDRKENVDKYNITTNGFSGTSLILSGIKDKSNTQISVPDYITEIGDGAFSGCTNLETVNLYNGIKKISSDAFSGCSNFKKIVYFGSYEEWQAISKDENWDTFIIDCEIEFTQSSINDDSQESGLIFTPIIKNGNIVAYSVLGAGTYKESNLVIPSSYKGKPVTKIARSAFNNTGFISVEIPETITKIDYAAFNNCKNLETVYWNAISCTAEKNHSAALFENCENLTNVIFGNNVEIIRGSAFKDCASLSDVSFPQSIKIIEDLAFSGCNSLFNIDIPDSVIKIGRAAFSNCGQLKSISIGAGVTDIEGGAFVCCDLLETVYFNAENCGDLVYWGSDLFTCSGINSGINIIIGRGVKRIPDNFCNYVNSSIMDARITKINKIIFEEGSNCEYIGNNAFYSCENITEIKIPSSVTYIGENAFSKCCLLETVYIGDNVTEIGNGAFLCCNALKNVRVPNTLKKLGTSAFSTDLQLQYNEYDNAYYLGNDINPYVVLILAKNREIKNCLINENTKIISDGAFSYCNWLTDITIPEGVVFISSAFNECFSLNSLYLPASVEGFVPSWQCQIQSYVVSEDNKYLYSINNCIIEKATKTLVCGNHLSIIPQDGSVIKIGDSAFSGANLTEIVIPEGVTHIGAEAFSNNNFVTKVVIPKSVKYIGNGAFSGCINLTNITIPDGVTEIGERVFSGCENLKSIIIPDSVTSLGWGAFYRCSSLTSITIPDSVTSIGNSAFAYCSGLISIKIPDGVTEIAPSMYENCSNLTSITIPNSVIAIGMYVFDGCSNLTDIYFEGTQEQWHNIIKEETWDNNTGNYTIHYKETV